jgi:2-oxoacid:acceptor oxidoreductase gamma subunit (pyruvate/2-ketoisovalerate family)
MPNVSDGPSLETGKTGEAGVPAAMARELSEIRLVGRGGQGVVTAGDLLGKAALIEGRHAQSIPTFGPERRGALSSATLRIGAAEILLKCSSTSPNLLLILDPTIWHHFPVVAGLAEDGILVFNTALSPDEIQEEIRSGKYGHPPPAGKYTLHTVDATGIALEVLGRPITNTAMMGAFSGASDLVGMDSIGRVLEERFGKRAEGNIQAARAAHDRLRSL